MFQCAPPELQRLAIAACNKLIVKNKAMIEINLKEGAYVETRFAQMDRNTKPSARNSMSLAAV
jgi:hypothetical protein